MRLVVTEKPSVANAIAKVIGADERKDGYLKGEGYLVTWCVGHLVELAQPEAYGNQYKKWDYDTLPIIPDEFRYEVKEDTKKQFGVVKDLMNSDEVTDTINCCDAGREGELIFRLAYKMAGCSKPIFRLWISSMEEAAILDGFKSLKLGAEYDNLYRSALARQQADWLVGINGTRLFTVLYKNKVLKVGRVQTPTLAMLVNREVEISGFQKQKYFKVEVSAGGVTAVSDRIDEMDRAEEIVRNITGQTMTVTEVTDEKKHLAPPKLFDLTSLQREANKMYGFTAKQTLDYTQSLYEKKLVTYPRTDSQYLSDDMGDTAQNVIDASVSTLGFIEKLSDTPNIKTVMNSKKVTDHHAIIPTIEIKRFDMSTLTEAEKKVLFLIATRLLMATGKDYEYINWKITVECGGTIFQAKAKYDVYAGWKAYEAKLYKHLKIQEKDADESDGDTYENADANQILGELKEGQTFAPSNGKITEHFTKPPAHFTESTLLSAMEHAGESEMDGDVERKGLGTPATRADIIEKLVRDGFVKRDKKQMIPTDDGIKLIAVLPDMVKSPQLTADWENELVLVSKGEIPMEVFLAEITEMVSSLVSKYQGISDKAMENNPFEGSFGGRNAATLGKCPVCKNDVLKGKFGVYCTGKCGMTFKKAMGKTLTDQEIRDVLAGKKILVRGLKGKSGKVYDAYLTPVGTEEYSYTDRDGKSRNGYRFNYEMSFPDKKTNNKN